MTTAADSPLVQLLDPAHRADPYPVYARIRQSGPMQLPDSNLTVFSTFAHCDEVVRHPASASDRLKSTVAQRMIAEGAAAGCPPEMLRLSIGIEDIRDILADLDQAIAAAGKIKSKY